ncbi:MAG TPA: thermonuclease family protein [Albitalea sp.]
MLATLLLCTVVGIADGDTLRARCATEAGPRTVSIRLAEIDAPERGQPFSRQSRQRLAALCFRQAAQVRPVGRDHYGRTVGHVACRGTDAGAEQVRAGVAWVFERYARTRSLRRLQAEARAARRGLWSDAAPLPPWDWRKRQRSLRARQPRARVD